MDCYQRLGVSKDAGTEDIKKAYRRLALEYHPDRNHGSKDAEDRFKAVTRAYETLRDPAKRARYDRFGIVGLNGRGAEGFDSSDAVELFRRDFGDGFEDLLGTTPSRQQPGARKGEALHANVVLTLAEVARGVTKRIRLTVLETCRRCDGTGAAAGSVALPCPLCKGSGDTPAVQSSLFAQTMNPGVCAACFGDGEIVESACRDCQAEGRVSRNMEIAVEVPAGASPENFITLRGRGNVGPRGGPRGDIVVALEVEEDRRFARRGADLLYELTVTFSQAALGWDFEIPTADGHTKVRVPAGTQGRQILRLRGKGLPVLEGGGPGDLLVRVIVWTPDRLSKEQSDALWDLRVVENPPPKSADRGRDRGFWSRVKDAFTN